MSEPANPTGSNKPSTGRTRGEWSVPTLERLDPKVRRRVLSFGDRHPYLAVALAVTAGLGAGLGAFVLLFTVDFFNSGAPDGTNSSGRGLPVAEIAICVSLLVTAGLCHAWTGRARYVIESCVILALLFVSVGVYFHLF